MHAMVVPSAAMGFLRDIGAGELIVILLILLLLFGSKRLPGVARSTGTALREFKAAVSGSAGDDEEPAAPGPADPATERSPAEAGGS